MLPTACNALAIWDVVVVMNGLHTARAATAGHPADWSRALISGLCALLLLSGAAVAAERDQAYRMHNRLAGVPPSGPVLDSMETLLLGGDDIGAANLAMQNSEFYRVTLKNFAAPWTNREQDKSEAKRS